MKKIGLLVCFALSINIFAKTDLSPIESSFQVSSYIVKEVGSSEMLMAKNKDAKVEPASLTKILTSIIAIESGKLEEIVTIPKEATRVEPSKAGFRAGEKIKLEDLVKAAMVNSSNDAAFAIAYHLGGNVKNFAKIMNQKAAKIGLKNSNFTNPAGFDRGAYAGHYSTAKDLLKLTEYAIKNRFFNEVAKLESIEVEEQKSGKIYSLKTHNKLLDTYKYAVGIKTGFTNKAGKCLIARAKKDNKDMVLVMLKAKADRWGDAENMFEKAFDMKAPEPELVDEAIVTTKKSTKTAKTAKVKNKTSAAKIITQKTTKPKNRLKIANKAKIDKKVATH